MLSQTTTNRSKTHQHLSCAALIALFSQMFSLSSCLAGTIPNPPASYVPGEVVVGITTATDDPIEDALLSTVGVIISSYDEVHAVRLQLPAALTVPDAIALLRRLPGVRYAEPNYIGHATSTPNDTYYNTPLTNGYPAQYGPQRVQADLAWNLWQPRQTAYITVLPAARFAASTNI